MANKVVIGFTGAFGSGCTTAAKHLRDTRNFHYILLSDYIRQEWERQHNGKAPSRLDLQRLGDQLRREHGNGVLVERGVETALQKSEDSSRLVIDGIRNVGEIDSLRATFGYQFTLLAVLASRDARWARIGSTYTDKKQTKDDFVGDDTRDSNEETDYGQQVELCLDKADILIDNSDPTTTMDFQRKILEFVDLATGAKPRPARQEEILMNIAFSSSHSSKCLKRHVGAVVVDVQGQVVGVGYNENPLGTKPCAEEPTYDYQCYRDILRNNHFVQLAQKAVRCPVCGEPLVEQKGPPWVCGACGNKGLKTNLEALFFPDRAMNWCTAVHAEVWAILAAGERARGGTLYTTTFPCFQCAEKLVQAGIETIFFTEIYPDPHSGNRLKLAGVDLLQFEGVRSSSFERIFSRNRPT